MHRRISKEYEVAVIGGGPGGIPAAIAAARRGRKHYVRRTKRKRRRNFCGGVSDFELIVRSDGSPAAVNDKKLAGGVRGGV